MSSISIRIEDRLEGTSNFNTRKARKLNTLEEHDLDGYVANVVEETTTNTGHTTLRNNLAKSKKIIYVLVKDNLMPMITPLKTTKECFYTLTNLYEKKASS